MLNSSQLLHTSRHWYLRNWFSVVMASPQHSLKFPASRLGTNWIFAASRLRTNWIPAASRLSTTWIPAASRLRTTWIPADSRSKTTWIRPPYTDDGVITHTRRQFKYDVHSLEKAILESNWGDTFNLVLNVPFWEGEFARLRDVKHKSIGTTGEDWERLSRLFDVLFICEDVRDHLNELMEVIYRTHGNIIISNFDEHIQAVLKTYNRLLEDHPEYIKQIEESIGKGIQALRQRIKFDWNKKHEAFY